MTAEKESIIADILELNPSRTWEFYAQFTVAELRRYYERLLSISKGKKG